MKLIEILNLPLGIARDPYYTIYLLCPQELLMQMGRAQLQPDGVLKRGSCPIENGRARIHIMEWANNGNSWHTSCSYNLYQ